MRDWNVVVTLKGRGFARPRRLLRRFGEVERTGFFNVLLLRVPSVPAFLEQLRAEIESGGELAAHVGHVYPVERTFTFADVAGFERQSVSRVCDGRDVTLPNKFEKTGNPLPSWERAGRGQGNEQQQPLRAYRSASFVVRVWRSCARRSADYRSAHSKGIEHPQRGRRFLCRADRRRNRSLCWTVDFLLSKRRLHTGCAEACVFNGDDGDGHQHVHHIQDQHPHLESVSTG